MILRHCLYFSLQLRLVHIVLNVTIFKSHNGRLGFWRCFVTVTSNLTLTYKKTKKHEIENITTVSMSSQEPINNGR